MRVLLIGSGGREHALAVGLAADPSVDFLAAAPGNPGIAQFASVHPVTATDPLTSESDTQSFTWTITYPLDITLLENQTHYATDTVSLPFVVTDAECAELVARLAGALAAAG